MSHSRLFGITAPLLALLLAAAPWSAPQAAVVNLWQDWVDRDNPLRTATTFTQWSDAGITGVGQEFVLAHNNFYFSYVLGGVGQVFARAQPFELPLDEHDLVAVYQDGVFIGTGNVNLGGVPRVPIYNTVDGSGAGGRAVGSRACSSRR